jgi:hypothetical protein
MMRRFGVHFVLLFALVFQNVALAMPCCAPEQAMEHGAHHAASADLHEEGCTAGSPLCCAVPSLPHTPVVAAIQNLSPVYVPTVHAFRISFHQSSPERPPRA